MKPGLILSVRNSAVRTVLQLIMRPAVCSHPLQRLGSHYGGWWIPQGVLNSDSLCICAGVGQDLSFDLALVSEYQCAVLAIDPTPRSINWVLGQQLPDDLAFKPIGISDRRKSVKFFEPASEDHVSYSSKNIQSTTAFVEAEVDSLSGIMESAGWKYLSLLKLDVEGAEHESLHAMLADGIHPSIICVEYDQPEPITWAIRTHRSLLSKKYRLIKVDGLNFTYLGLHGDCPCTS